MKFWEFCFLAFVDFVVNIALNKQHMLRNFKSQFS